MLPIPALERAPLATRVLVTVATLILAFGLVVGAVSAVAVAATKAVFPPNDAEPLASGSAAGEAEDEPVAAPASSSKAGTKAPSRTGSPKVAGGNPLTPKTSGKVSSKTTAKRAKGDSTE